MTHELVLKLAKHIIVTRYLENITKEVIENNANYIPLDDTHLGLKTTVLLTVSESLKK